MPRIALTVAGSADEARAAANGLIDAAEATRNPWALSFALHRLRPRLPRRRSRPRAGGPAPGPGIAQDSGNRVTPSHIWRATLSRLEAEHGDPLAALDYVTLAIRNYHDAGNTTLIVPRWPSSPPFSTGSDATNRRPPSPVSHQPPRRTAVPEINTAIAHLREVLGDETYESLARKGETMTTAAMATYAFDQIDQARAELNAASK